MKERVHFRLEYGWLDGCVQREEFLQLHESKVADTQLSDETFLDEPFEFTPRSS